MPEKVKVMGNTEEEKDVEQVAQAISRFLKNYGVSIDKGEHGYEIYLLDPADQKEYRVAYLVPKKDETTGDSYYEMFLFFNVFLPAYTNKGVLPISKYHLKPEMMPKDPESQYFTLLGLMSPIVEKMKSYLENFEITDSDVCEVVPCFTLYLKKQPHA